ncbi:MAG: DUF1634 domain-containing protein [Acidimicrobiales bacterium]
MTENDKSSLDDSTQSGVSHDSTDNDVHNHDAARHDVTVHGQPEDIAAEPASKPLTAEQEKYAARQDEKVRKVETIISVVLRTGVVVSVIVVAVGLAISFSHHPEYLSNFSYKGLTNVHYSFPDTFSTLFHSLSIGQGRGVVVLGLALLILTPVMRVAVSIFAFVYEEDPIMVAVTSFVLLMLVSSFFLGRAGG